WLAGRRPGASALFVGWRKYRRGRRANHTMYMVFSCGPCVSKMRPKPALGRRGGSMKSIQRLMATGAAAVMVLAACGGSGGESKPSASTPNILFVVMDDV